jgi:hypothetical protein
MILFNRPPIDTMDEWPVGLPRCVDLALPWTLRHKTILVKPRNDLQF